MANCEDLLAGQAAVKEEMVKIANDMNKVKAGKGYDSMRIVVAANPMVPITMVYDNLDIGKLGFNLQKWKRDSLDRLKLAMDEQVVIWNKAATSYIACESNPSGSGGGGDGSEDGGLGIFDPKAFEKNSDTFIFALVAAVVIAIIFVVIKFKKR